MRPSTHYYVLSLSDARCALFEAFRDQLIAVENQGFPVCAPVSAPTDRKSERRSGLMRTVDRKFGRYQAREPLGLVVVGSRELQAAFDAVTTHGAAILGRVTGDHASTSIRSLGQIVWPILKEAMSGALDRAMHDLRACDARGRVETGLEAVFRAAERENAATLLVEDDYHRRGTVRTEGAAVVMSNELDVRSAADDAVDSVIENVLEAAGRVVFTPPGLLRDYGHIALLCPARPSSVAAAAGVLPPTDGRDPG